MRLPASRLFLIAGAALLLAASIPSLPAAFAGADPQAGVRAGSALISEAEYWNLVEHSRQIVAGLQGFPAEKIEQGLAALAAQWETVESVRLVNDRVVPIESGYLLSALRAASPDLNRIKSLLSALQLAHREYPARIFGEGHLASLEQILARPEFQWREAGPNPINEWLARLWERITAWLNRLFGQREISINLDVPGTSPLAVLTYALLTLILFYVFRNLLLDFAGEARIDEAGNPADEILTSQTAFKRAQELSRGGDHRSAVRYLYLSSLLLLDERGLLRYDRSKTNREYLRSVSASPGLAGPLKEVVEVFDDVWYGQHELNEESFKHYSDRVEELREQKE